MCISKAELDKKVQEIRKYKAMAEEAAEIQKALEAEVNGLDTEITDSAKIIYKSQTRSTLDKKRLEEDLGSLEEYTKVTEYNVLRIK